MEKKIAENNEQTIHNIDNVDISFDIVRQHKESRLDLLIRLKKKLSMLKEDLYLMTKIIFITI